MADPEATRCGGREALRGGRSLEMRHGSIQDLLVLTLLAMITIHP
jgi:hypothetical protein